MNGADEANRAIRTADLNRRIDGLAEVLERIAADVTAIRLAVTLPLGVTVHVTPPAALPQVTLPPWVKVTP